MEGRRGRRGHSSRGKEGAGAQALGGGHSRQGRERGTAATPDAGGGGAVRGRGAAAWGHYQRWGCGG